MAEETISRHPSGASWITDKDGNLVQHLQYLPYGEPYVNQRAAGSTYRERFTFTGKERDEETGYGYFGARYMDYELMTSWLSVDPLADKYPSISPYAYCAWNPVKLIDPDGKEIDEYKLNTTDGTLKLTKKTADNFDVIYTDNSDEPYLVSKGVLNGKNVGDDISKTGFSATNGKHQEGIDLMWFISSSTNIELGGWGYDDNKREQCLEVGKWDQNGSCQSRSSYQPGEFDKKGTRRFRVHTHPGTKDGQGGFGKPSTSDIGAASRIPTDYYIISRNHGLTQYDKKGNWYIAPNDNRTPSSLRKYIKLP